MSSVYHRTLKSLGLRKSPKQKTPSPTQVLRENIIKSYAERGIRPMPGTVEKKIRDIKRSRDLDLRDRIFEERSRNMNRAENEAIYRAMERERDMEIATAFPHLNHIEISHSLRPPLTQSQVQQYARSAAARAAQMRSRTVMSFGGPKKKNVSPPRPVAASVQAQAIAQLGAGVRERLYGTPLQRSLSQEERLKARERYLAQFGFKSTKRKNVVRKSVAPRRRKSVAPRRRKSVRRHMRYL